MIGCEECAASRECNGLWNRFDDIKCMYCSARRIQFIGGLPIARSVASERRTKALQEGVAAGHDEAEIRNLVKGPTAYAPLVAAEKKGKKK